MKEELLEAIYGTVERLEQKVDELSASPKIAEAGSIPVPVSVDTCKLEKAILSIDVKEGESIDKLARLREAICIFTDLTKKEPEIKRVVKCRRSTSALQRELVSLSTHKVGGIRGVAVKCLDITKNSDCEGSSLERN